MVASFTKIYQLKKLKNLFNLNLFMRYSRNIALKEIGEKGQRILNKKTATIVGLGAIGSISSELLARNGINLILIDNDKIDKTNLQRQLLFTEKDIGKLK